MAPKRVAKKPASKRAAKKSAPPPPPAESSEETQSSSRSEESEDEEAIAAPTPALRNTPAPQKGDESESSEEDDDEGEEENQPAHAAPKNQPPPPQEEEDSDTSGSDDEEEEPTRAATKNQPPPPQEEEDSDTSGSDDDEEEEEPTRAAPPSSPKKQPPQPEKGEDSDTSGDDDDEEEAPPPNPAPMKEASALKPSASAAVAKEAKKPGVRVWSMDDEVRILEAIVAHQKQHDGTFPQPDALIDVLAGKLDNTACGSTELKIKLGTLKRRYHKLSDRGEVPGNEHDRRILDLSKIVWDGDKTTAAATNNGHQQKGFEEMCELYPCLAEEVKELEAARPGMCKREFGKMDHDKARSMDEKIKKQRVLQIRVEMRRDDLAKEVTKALMDLV